MNNIGLCLSGRKDIHSEVLVTIGGEFYMIYSLLFFLLYHDLFIHLARILVYYASILILATYGGTNFI